MGARSEQKTIGGRTYTVTQMPPTLSFPIQIRLVQIIASVAGPLLQQIQGASREEITQEAIGKGLISVSEAIATHLPPDECLEFAQKLLDPSFVSVDSVPLQFEQEFMGDDMVNLYPALGFVLEVNYAKFFSVSGVGKVIGLVKDKFPSQSSSESPPI